MGDAGAVGVGDRTDGHAGDDDSAGLCAGGQRHMAGVHLRHAGGDAGGAGDRVLRAQVGFAGLALHVHDAFAPGWAASLAGWALLLAYVATAASVAAGFFNYANVLMHAFFGLSASPSLLIALAVVASGAMAYRDIKVSAEAMLWMEAASVTCIVVVLALTLWKHGLHLDWEQLRLKGVSRSGVRLGLVLALFSFVGFESATTLGEEAREPLKTIPRAVLQCAVGCGVFFTVCAYTEVLSFRGAVESLDQAAAPLHAMATRAGANLLGTVIDIGAMISMFACTLACITAGARVLMLMAHRGLAPRTLSATHKKNETPALGSDGDGGCLPGARRGAGGEGREQHGYLRLDGGAGDVRIHYRICAGVREVALPLHLKRTERLSAGVLALAAAGAIAMVLALAGSVYPVPAGAYAWLPYIYLVYLLAGLAWYVVGRQSVAVAQQQHAPPRDI